MFDRQDRRGSVSAQGLGDLCGEILFLLLDAFADGDTGIARDFDAGRTSRTAAASCLLHASESAVQVALEAIQSLGGNGYINEFASGRLLRDAKLYAIGAGTNEIRRMLIGRELFAGNY